MKIKIYADGANLQDMISLSKKKYIKGLTTNPTLMRQSGVSNYKVFAKLALKKISKIPISFEVFADEFKKMYLQAKKIKSWGNNVYVKIPIVNTKGKSSKYIIKKLLYEGVKLNITAITHFNQVKNLLPFLNKKTPTILSIFAGRIADTGVDPVIHIQKSLNFVKKFKNIKILWASPREVLNIYQAEKIGCHIITVTPQLIEKFFSLKKYNLYKYSIDTVKMFYNDAKKSNFQIS
jgi:transaldolase